MRTITKIAAVILLLWGVPISLLALVSLRDPDPKAREGALPAVLIFGLPPMAAGAGLWIWASKGSQKGARDRLKDTFFRLIQEGDGKVTVLRFAMETGLEGDDAKTYLDERAIEFNATFEATAQGAVAYVFDMGQPALPDIQPSQDSLKALPEDLV